VGKTHLAVAVLRGLILEKGVSGLFYDYGDLLRTIQSTWERDSELTEAAVLDSVRSVDLLLLDDLGSTRPSLWVQEVLFNILNARYNAERPTLLTTNHFDAAAEAGASPGRARDLQDASLEHQIGSRLRSRLHEMCRTVDMDGEDFRRTYKRANFSAG
jgi:DNA replication protein DnaC